MSGSLNKDTPAAANSSATPPPPPTGTHRQATVLPTSSSSAAADIANVVEGISWNTCFSHLQWYRKDIHIPLCMSNAKAAADCHGAACTTSRSSSSSSSTGVRCDCMPECSSPSRVLLHAPTMAAADSAMPTDNEVLFPTMSPYYHSCYPNSSSQPLQGSSSSNSFFAAECSSSGGVSAAVAYGAVPGPFSLFGHYWRSRQLMLQDESTTTVTAEGKHCEDSSAFQSAFQSSSNEWYEERMARAFVNVSVSEVAWLMTYISKAIAYMRVEMWMHRNGCMESSMHQCNRQQKLCCSDAAAITTTTTTTTPAAASSSASSPHPPPSMSRALRSIVHASEDLRQMSDAARFVSRSVNNASRIWVNVGMQSSMGPLYAHLSCRMLELASLMDEEAELSSSIMLQKQKQQKQRFHHYQHQQQHSSYAASAYSSCIMRHAQQQQQPGFLSFPSPYYYMPTQPSPMHAAAAAATHPACAHHHTTKSHRRSKQQNWDLSFPAVDASYEYMHPGN